MNDIHIVTGASSGVGAALSRHLARTGRTVLGLARRRTELLEIQAGHEENMHILDVDLASEAGRQRVAEMVDGRFRVRTLVHNAAVATRGYLKDLDYKAYRDLMGINLEAPLFLTQALLPDMVVGSRVLHLSSGSAYRPLAYHGLYSVSKAALVMLYQAWNADYPDGELIVGSAMPGVVHGPMQDAAREGDNPSVEVFRGFKEDGRLIQPQRVAEFLTWLLFETDDDSFRSQDWNVLDESHHRHWLSGSISD